MVFAGLFAAAQLLLATACQSREAGWEGVCLAAETADGLERATTRSQRGALVSKHIDDNLTNVDVIARWAVLSTLQDGDRYLLKAVQDDGYFGRCPTLDLMTADRKRRMQKTPVEVVAP